MAPKRTKSGTDQGAGERLVLPLLTPRLPEKQDRRGAREGSASQLFERIQKGGPERRSFRERRATRRVAVGFELEARTGAEVLAQRTYDLSTFGLSIREGTPLEKGTALALRLFLPDDPATPLALNGVVVGPFDEQGGVRVKFVDLPLAAVRRIHRLVK
jgi:hypothetical protein